ncbi:MAG: hypothetical protein ABI557_21650 [Aureliella sp.]
MKFLPSWWRGLVIHGLLLAGLTATSAEPNDDAGAVEESSPREAVAAAPDLRWWKGNLHTHSLWSDGDEFPEMIAAWYLDHNYNFLALSDHNTLGNDLRWMPYEDIVKRADAGILARYQQRFGHEWVETREVMADEPAEGKTSEDNEAVDQATDKQSPKLEVRLKPLSEFRCLLDQAGRFLMIQGEEISDQAGGKPLHMNATNLQELIRPVGGATIREVMQNNLRQVLEQEAATGREMLPHLNHPNFHYAVTADDIAHVIQEHFFEIFNGHPGVNQLGDHDHISIERMWDVVNAVRLIQLDAPPLMGLGNDDSHEYHGLPGARPGRAWVMVRSRYLTPEHLIRAMKAGDFYASTGVVLDDVGYNAATKTLSLDIQAVDGVEFTTEFVATLQPPKQESSAESDALPKLPAAEDIGKVVAISTSLAPSYAFQGNEVYVRARVTSSAAHVDPNVPDQLQQAWTQPIVP